MTHASPAPRGALGKGQSMGQDHTSCGRCDRMPSLAMLLAVMAALAWLALAPARAEETLPPFIAQFLKQLEEQNDLKIAWGRARQLDDGDFVLEEVSWAVHAKGKVRPVAHSALMRFSGLREDGDLLRCAKVSIVSTDIDAAPDVFDEPHSDKAIRVRIPEVIFEDNSILKTGAGRNAIERLFEGQVVSARVVVPEITLHSPFALKVGKVVYTFGGNRRTMEGKGTFTISRIALPPEVSAMMGRKDALGQLGYDRFVLSVGAAWTTRWDEKDRNHVDFMLRLGMDQAGRLGIEVGELVLPLSLMRMLVDARESKRLEKMIDAEDPALMNMLQNDITLQTLRIFWEDEGLTRRLLAMEARRKGLEQKDVIDAWAAAPQAFLFMLGLPDVGAQASDALRTFLADPRRLDISMHARAPMNLATLMTLLEDPKGLVDTLNLKITANGPAEKTDEAQ